MNKNHEEGPGITREGQKYRCSVCGSEILVIRARNGSLAPRCCNEPMVLLKQTARMYRCSVCGSEVAVIQSRTNNLHLVCCNTPMSILRRKMSDIA
jgi:desulfoferrodoxin-like iron-binding protein